MINGSHYRLTHLTVDLNVNVNSQQLTRVTNYRYLGIEVDESLGWQSQEIPSVKRYLQVSGL